jgi:hypothetical protein
MCNANSNDAAQVKVFRISGQNSSAICSWMGVPGWGPGLSGILALKRRV